MAPRWAPRLTVCSIARPAWKQTDPGVGRRDRAVGRSTAGLQADRRLGPPDFRGGAAARRRSRSFGRRHGVNIGGAQLLLQVGAGTVHSLTVTGSPSSSRGSRSQLSHYRDDGLRPDIREVFCIL